MSMTPEVLMLINLGGLTLLAYLIAINAHGAARLAISYLFATLMLAGTVFTVVQYVNSGIDALRQQEIQRLTQEKQVAEDKLKQQQEVTVEEKSKTGASAKARELATRGSAFATRLQSVDLQDRSVDFDGLVARAVALNKDVDAFKQEVETSLPSLNSLVPQPAASLREAAQVVKEAATYYRLFYNSEDGDQEDLRLRVMRQKARSANELFQKALTQLAGE